jgi:hypothetical protein
MHRPHKRIGWPTIIGLILVVIAFMVLSLLVTATGTARFAVSMGYDASVGYAVGPSLTSPKECCWWEWSPFGVAGHWEFRPSSLSAGSAW